MNNDPGRIGGRLTQALGELYAISGGHLADVVAARVRVRTFLKCICRDATLRQLDVVIDAVVAARNSTGELPS